MFCNVDYSVVGSVAYENASFCRRNCVDVIISYSVTDNEFALFERINNSFIYFGSGEENHFRIANCFDNVVFIDSGRYDKLHVIKLLECVYFVIVTVACSI